MQQHNGSRVRLNACGRIAKVDAVDGSGCGGRGRARPLRPLRPPRPLSPTRAYADTPLTLTASSIYNIFLRSKLDRRLEINHAPPRYDHYRSFVCGVLFAPFRI
jgi:hypothetical protein